MRLELFRDLIYVLSELVLLLLTPPPSSPPTPKSVLFSTRHLQPYGDVKNVASAL